MKRCNKRWIDSVDPHKHWSTDLENFCCCLVCLLQWRTLFQHMYFVKMCKILLIFVAKFQKFFCGYSPQTSGWGGAQPLPKPYPFDRPHTPSPHRRSLRGVWGANPPNAKPRASQQSWQESCNCSLHNKFTARGWWEYCTVTDQSSCSRPGMYLGGGGGKRG